jgi:hypothetical protein
MYTDKAPKRKSEIIVGSVFSPTADSFLGIMAVITITIIPTSLIFCTSYLSYDSIVQTASAEIRTHSNSTVQKPDVQFPGHAGVSRTNASTATNTTKFLIYDNPTSGIRMQYPSDWSVIEGAYNPGTNNTIVQFFSPSKTSSKLGNVSGVSGHFVPYLDVFVFDSKNTSLDQIMRGITNNYANNTDFAIHKSEPFIFNGSNSNNRKAYILDYTVTVGGDELFRKMQVYSEFGSKVYTITYTSQQSSFSNYVPIVQKMINSLQIRNSIK